MGTGSSRNQVTIETAPKPALPAGDSFDVITREKHRPVRQSTIEKIVTETGAEVGNVYTDQDDLLDVTSVHNDDSLEDIHDLEQTFDSLGIPSSSNHSSDQVNNKITDRHSQEHDLAPLKTEWSVTDVSVPASQNSTERESGAEDTAAAVGRSGVRSTSVPQTRLDILPTSLVNNNNSTKSAPTKLPWSLPEPTNPPDEWIYRKSVVDGFDPDKFRKANRKDASGDENKSTVSSAENIMVLHANSVPDYDLSEQQILDSIEKEFVS